MTKRRRRLAGRVAPLLVGLGISAFGVPAAADLAIPVEPPSPHQVQDPDAKQPVAREAVPVAVTLAPPPATVADPTAPTVPTELAGLVKAELEQALGASATLVLVGSAKAPATVGPDPQVVVSVLLAPRPAGGAGPAPAAVTLVILREGKESAREEFTIDPDNRKPGVAAMVGFLRQHLPLTPIGSRPHLRVWMEARDGAQVRIGSEVAIFWQPTEDGYVSLYHFGSSGTVNRLFPNVQAPDNFVHAGQIYRFPADTGYLTFAGPPGEETLRAVITRYPSNTSRVQPGGLRFKGDPLRIIPTHYPMLFTDEGITRVFALPPTLFGETHITYKLNEK